MQMWKTMAALAVLVPAAGDGTAVAGEAARGFHESFDRLERGRWYVSSGWANGRHQSCLWHRDRVSVADGVLRLALTTDPKGDRGLSCAEVQSKGRYGYGTFEARVRVPYAAGMNANVFTFIGPPQDRPHHEIDFEFISPDRPVLQTNYYTAGEGGHEEVYPMEGDGRFRDLAVTWEPGVLEWYLDGELIREERSGDLPTEPQKIYMSLWSTGTLTDWMGDFDPAGAPHVLEVDWLAWTPQGAECAFEASLLCRKDAKED